MTIPFRRSLCQGVVLLALVALIAGCSGQSTVESFHPSDGPAEDALNAALTAWQGGQAKPGLIETSKARVQIDDEVWESGAKLKSFEIVEVLAGDGPPKFSVKLTLEGAAAPQDAIYVVVGKDPLMVMTEKQYNRNSDM